MASEFSRWAKNWMKAARGEGLPGTASELMQQVLDLWEAPIPGAWQRGSGGKLSDARVLDPMVRYCRGNWAPRAKRRGEHAIEYEVLAADRRKRPRTWLGGRLIDGVNAFPLAKDEHGKRKGNVEADMLLLTREAQQWRLLVVEVKDGSNNAWYGTVELLRQMRLLEESGSARQLFEQRIPTLKLPKSTPVTGLVLAPDAFFTSGGKKGKAVAPAVDLLDVMRRKRKIDARLATWDQTASDISERKSLGESPSADSG